MSVLDVTDIDQLKEEVGQLVGPFFDKYTGLDGEIKKREQKIEDIKKEITELRAQRSYLRTIVRNINPDLIPSIHTGNGNGKKKKGGWQRGKKSFGQESIQAMTVIVQSNKEELNAMNDGEGFRPLDIYARDEWRVLKSDSAVGALMGHLHETGILHLSKWVRGKPFPGKPTGKFYKVV